MNPGFFAPFAAVACSFAVSCAPSTPAARIAASPGQYQKLPARQQTEVAQGQLSRGMSPEAVYLAWGNPDRRYHGSADGRATMRWDYVGTQSIYTHNAYGGYRSGHAGPYRSAAFGPEIIDLPYLHATVNFIDGSVDSWESRN